MNFFCVEVGKAVHVAQTWSSRTCEPETWGITIETDLRFEAEATCSQRTRSDGLLRPRSGNPFPRLSEHK